MNAFVRPALFAAAVAAAAITAPAHAQVGVSINVPGIYGQLDIGGYPRPETIYAQPTVIERAPDYARQPPLYLHVQPGQERQWRRYCRQYDACGRPVYFVRDTWYQNVYAPRYRQMHGGDHGDPRGRDDRDGPRGGPRGDDRGGPRGEDRGGPRGDDRGHDDRGPGDRGRGEGHRD